MNNYPEGVTDADFYPNQEDEKTCGDCYLLTRFGGQCVCVEQPWNHETNALHPVDSSNKACGEFIEYLSYIPWSFFRFPRIANPPHRSQQIKKIHEECDEAWKALDFLETQSELFPNSKCEQHWRHEYGMELLDVIHAVETALHMEFSECEIKKLRDEVEKKNRKLGYYEED